MDIFGIKSSDDTVNLYFVQSIGSCSKEMRSAFTVSQNANLNSNIVDEGEVDVLPKRKNCVFIVDEFKGETFKKLILKDCLVVGPKCLSTCILKRLAIPENQSPVFNLAMQGLIVCATKLKRSKKEELATVIGYMGGHYQDQLTLATTHLVADEWKSVKCEEANEHGIPVMSSSWVKAVWEESSKNDDIGIEFFTKYRLPAFKGFYITCSNLAQSVKVKLQKVIEENGGVYMPALEQNKTNLLIIGDPVDGKKFQHAQLWKIPCVKPSWLYESAEKRFPLSFKNHIVSARPKCSTPTSDLPSFMSNDVSAVPISDTSNMEINETNTTLGSVCSLDRRGSKKLANPKSNNDYKKHLEKLDMSEVISAGLFLDGCKVYLSGFINSEMEKLKKILNNGGATIFNRLSESVSHVIVGDFNIDDAKTLSQFNQKPHVVNVEWLITSIKTRSLAPVLPYLCITSGSNNKNCEYPPQLSSPLGSKAVELLKRCSNNSLENSAKENTPSTKVLPRKLFVNNESKNRSFDGLQSNTINKDNVTELQKGVVEDKQVVKRVASPDKGTCAQINNNNTTNVTVASDLSTTFKEIIPFFDGLMFVVAGFEESTTTPIVETINRVGGNVATSQFHGVADYAVVPLDGTHEQFSSMETVTVLWVEDCWEQGKVVPVEYYHQPIMMKEGCYPLKGVTLCITGFIGKERSYIGHTATSLGAIVQDSFSRKDHPDKGILRSTHLVCKQPEGSKYSAAKKWGLPTVSKDWLTACAATGVKLPEEQYNITSGEAETPTSITDSSFNKRVKKSDELIPKTEKRVVSERQVIKETSFHPPGEPDNISFVPKKDAQLKSSLDSAAETQKENNELELSTFQTPVSVRPSRIHRLQLEECSSKEMRQDITLGAGRRLSCPSPGPSPGHIDTPSSPYGQVFTDCTPSPQTRKRWKKWIDNLPDLYEGTPIFARQRRPSTPLNVLMKQLWVKFGGVNFDGIEPKTGNLLPEGPYAAWAHDKSHEEMEIQNGEIVVRGTNISSADIQSSALESQKDTENNFNKNQFCEDQNSSATRSDNTEVGEFQPRLNADESSDEELAPSQLKNVMSDRLAKRMKNVLQTVPTDSVYSNGEEEKKGRGVKRKSGDIYNAVEWNWPSLSSNNSTKPKSDEKENHSSTILQISKEPTIESNNRNEFNEEKGIEEEEEEKDIRKQKRRIFVLSNIPASPRSKYESIIHNLGGETNSSISYDPETTHLIIEKPVRSEKLLCCIASGKWVLHVSYMTNCYQARMFLPEEDYEWGNERSRERLPSLNFGSTEYELATSAHKWRVQRTELGKVGAYTKFKAVLFTTEQKTLQYSRLLAAGGATILDKSKIMDATHVFWDEGKVELPVKKEKLKANKILLLKPIYLGDYLMKSHPLKPLEYIIK